MSFNPKESVSVCEQAPTLVEINIHGEKDRKRSNSRGKKLKFNKNAQGPANFGVLGSNGQSIEDNFRNQLLMTSLNDEFIEQWHNDSKQKQEKKEKKDDIRNKLKEAKDELV